MYPEDILDSVRVASNGDGILLESQFPVDGDAETNFQVKVYGFNALGSSLTNELQFTLNSIEDKYPEATIIDIVRWNTGFEIYYKVNNHLRYYQVKSHESAFIAINVQSAPLETIKARRMMDQLIDNLLLYRI